MRVLSGLASRRSIRDRGSISQRGCGLLLPSSVRMQKCGTGREAPPKEFPKGQAWAVSPGSKKMVMNRIVCALDDSGSRGVSHCTDDTTNISRHH